MEEVRRAVAQELGSGSANFEKFADFVIQLMADNVRHCKVLFSFSCVYVRV